MGKPSGPAKPAGSHAPSGRGAAPVRAGAAGSRSAWLFPQERGGVPSPRVTSLRLAGPRDPRKHFIQRGGTELLRPVWLAEQPQRSPAPPRPHTAAAPKLWAAVASLPRGARGWERSVRSAVKPQYTGVKVTPDGRKELITK